MRQFILLIVFLIGSLSAGAQTRSYKWSVDVGGGVYGAYFDTTHGGLTKLSLARYVSPSFDITLANSLGVMQINPSPLLEITASSLNLRYKFFNDVVLDEDAALKPYVLMGPALSTNYGKIMCSIHAGVGLRVNISERVAIFSEYNFVQTPGASYQSNDPRDVLNIYAKKRLSYWTGAVGLCFQLGGSPDLDGDGVCRDDDRCPDTPKGVKVDRHGCPIDTDKDGVPDYLDLCPKEAGSPAFAGCPAPKAPELAFEDRDFDGVFDADDECPDTPGDAETKGCPDDGSRTPLNLFSQLPERPSTPQPQPQALETPARTPKTEFQAFVMPESIPAPETAPSKPTSKNTKPTPEPSKPTPKITKPETAQPIAPPPSAKAELELDIFFDFDAYTLTPTEKQKLNKLLQLLNRLPQYSITIVGNTDSAGRSDYNHKLSLIRAKTVENYLVKRGLDKKRIISKGLGEINPQTPNNSQKNQQQNRRVSIQIIHTH